MPENTILDRARNVTACLDLAIERGPTGVRLEVTDFRDGDYYVNAYHGTPGATNFQTFGSCKRRDQLVAFAHAILNAERRARVLEGKRPLLRPQQPKER